MVAQWDLPSNQAEFWSSLGIPPRPYFSLIVTIAMDLNESITEYPVTSSITTFEQAGSPGSAETIIQIGGTVLGAGQALADAWLMLQDNAGQSLQATNTDENGHYIFTRLTAGNYQLRVRAQGFAEPTPPIAITVPSPTGNYDVQLT
jgi:hypothetical protein